MVKTTEEANLNFRISDAYYNGLKTKKASREKLLNICNSINLIAWIEFCFHKLAVHSGDIFQ